MEMRNASPIQIRQLGIEALAKALGPVGMVRFLQQFETGSGNYTRDRDELLKDVNIEDILGQIKQMRHNQPAEE
ncbi:hypothetical protein [Chroococcidiopsis sp. CCNUC1]|uniref:hypothetical protein n=1 Tax=Chroococcidiopsis sp. CCNUC1 TaxID=2653189 RepID=UPI000D06F5B2|nr:hypothetical protein [Chroococcidiopsis sp. CCNUC1]PSB49484.1 hypothetical protein C7B80_01720 [Cyanosarcina cf. burmensis CCALA 770]URD53748.1 hypothetical protein M5J74_32150 [Chroococcidiopsis sp. CCNUC1]